MEMCRAEKYHSTIQKITKLHLAEAVRTRERRVKMLLEKIKQAESSPRFRRWHRRLSRDFHCSGQLDLT